MYESEKFPNSDIYKSVIEQIEASVFVTNSNGVIIYVNPYFELNTGYTIEEVIGKNPRILQSGDHTNEFYQSLWNTIRDGETWKGEIKNKRKNGSFYWVKVTISPVKDNLGSIKYYVAVEHDITEDKRKDKQRLRRQNFLKDIQSLSKTGGFEHDVLTDEVTWTDEMFKIFEIPKSNGPESYQDHLMRFDVDDRKKYLTAYTDLMLNGTPLVLTLRVTDNLHNKKYLKFNYRAVLNEFEEVVKLYGSVMDITEEKMMGDSLAAAYRERGVMLAEIHHRVKNNLALVSGLLQLQYMHENSKRAENVLEKSINRVNSIAFIYEEMYKSRNFSRISIASIIERHLDTLARAYPSKTNIKISKSLDDVYLDINQALPLALLINETLSNSFRYAFPNRIDGLITIELRQKMGSIYLRLSDNGIGMTNKQYTDDTSVGHMIIHTLIQQLDAKSTIKVLNGVSYEIEFEKKVASGPGAVIRDFDALDDTNIQADKRKKA